MSTESTLAAEFLEVARKEIRQRAARIESCLEKLDGEQVWGRAHETENSIGNLILHLCGNVRQWIVSGVGGAPDNRARDAEFAQREAIPKDALIKRLRDTTDEADRILAGLTAGALLEKHHIQVYDVSVIQAVTHVAVHFAEHTGQIIWATKRITGEDLGFYSYLNKDAAKAPDLAKP
jgi:uncharacterized damage-inducible protein DinB